METRTVLERWVATYLVRSGSLGVITGDVSVQVEGDGDWILRLASGGGVERGAVGRCPLSLKISLQDLTDMEASRVSPQDLWLRGRLVIVGPVEAGLVLTLLAGVRVDN